MGISSPKKVDLAQVTDSQLLIRARMLRENGCYLCKQSFLMRKNYMNHEETGMLKKGTQRATPPPNPMMDPSMMTEMLKGNLTSMVPMVVVGGWINWHFSGFVTTKVPFPLTLRFKGMLQRGIELQSLDASWVSSASWYFLNVFGLRSIYSLVLGENNAADQARAMQESMSMQAGGMPPDSKAAHNLAAAVHEEQSQGAGKEEERSSGGSYYLDEMSDEEMDDDGAAGPSRGQQQGRARSSNSFNAITPAQLAQA